MEISIPGYKFINFLSSGSQAAVVKANKNGIDYAVRIISDLHNPINVARAVRELVLLKNCDHENIIEVLDVPSSSIHSIKLENLYITVPLMDFTFEEFAKIDLWRKENENAFIRHFMIQVLRGVDYLHRNAILHRDLSSRNVMIDRNLCIKIIDFGLAREHKNNLTMAPFTLPYQAPERVLEFEYYDSKADMWSVGCLFAELVAGHRLFLTSPTNSPTVHLLRQSFVLEEKIPEIFQLQLKQILNDIEIQYVCGGSYWPIEKCLKFPSPKGEQDDKEIHSAQNGYVILKNLLRLDPQERWSAEQALTNPFFGDTTPKNGKLKNPDECQLVFDQINFALENEDINQLTSKNGYLKEADDLLQQQILQAPRL